MIKVSINNEIQSLAKECSVKQALETLGYEANAMLGVAVNETFVSKDDWAQTLLKENDRVDILNPVSGG